MGYRTSNAAYAHDVQPDVRYGTDAARRVSSYDPSSYNAYGNAYAPAPEVRERPGFDVITGAGREADQETSPAFRRCIKIFAVLAAIFVAVGMFRVGLASATAGILNSNAELEDDLEEARDDSSDLEVMYSVYSSPSRIRSLAEGYGMVEAGEGVTLDFTEYVTVVEDEDAGEEVSDASDAEVSTDEAEVSDSSDVDVSDEAEVSTDDASAAAAAADVSTVSEGSTASMDGTSEPDDVVTIVEDA